MDAPPAIPTGGARGGDAGARRALGASIRRATAEVA